MTTERIELPMAIKVPGTDEWTKLVEIDEMTGYEEDILADQRRAENGQGGFLRTGPQRVSDILTRITVAIGDVRRPAGKDRWNDPDFFRDSWKVAYSSDRVYTLIQARILSQGPQDVSTQTCPACKKEIPRVVTDLSQQKVKRVPLDVASKGVHSAVLPRSGEKVTWRSIAGERDEEQIENIMKTMKSEFITAVLFMRLISVNGERPPGGAEYLRRMRSADRRFFSTAADNAEGGIDTDITVICDGCEQEFTKKLEVMRPDFFFPSEFEPISNMTSPSSPTLGGGATKILSASPSAVEDAR